MKTDGNTPLLSLVVAVYDRTDFLEICLQSIMWQSFRDFEIVVAEDGASEEMKAFVDSWVPRSPFSITHLTQPKDGFGKTRIYNKAIPAARGTYLLFIDGDCVLHRHYLREYARRVAPNLCLFGRRVPLDGRVTRAVMKRMNPAAITWCRILFSATPRKEDALLLPFRLSKRKNSVYGSSFCVPRADLLRVNGFDEDYRYPCYGEDHDLEARLRNAGLEFDNVKNRAIQYHLDHPRTNRDAERDISERLFTAKMAAGPTACANGIVKH